MAVPLSCQRPATGPPPEARRKPRWHGRRWLGPPRRWRRWAGECFRAGISTTSQSRPPHSANREQGGRRALARRERLPPCFDPAAFTGSNRWTPGRYVSDISPASLRGRRNGSPHRSDIDAEPPQEVKRCSEPRDSWSWCCWRSPGLVRTRSSRRHTDSAPDLPSTRSAIPLRTRTAISSATSPSSTHRNRSDPQETTRFRGWVVPGYAFCAYSSPGVIARACQ